MSKREALRAFQARLAGRLQAARTSESSASWLAVEAGGERYLLPLAHAGEIFPWSAPHPVPYTAPWFIGVASLRGGVYGVVDLPAFSGQVQAAAPVEALRAGARLVALNELLEVNCVLQIDRLVGLRGLDAFKRSDAPPSDAPAWRGHAYVDADGQRWQEIDLQSLSRLPQFMDIGI